MSLFSEIESFLGLGAVVAEITTDINVEEKVVITGLTGVSALITAGASVADAVSSELETLLPGVKTAIANVDAKVDGAAAKLKTELASAQTWLAARTITSTAGAEAGGKLSVANIHIA